MSDKQNNTAALKKILRKFNNKEVTRQEEISINAWYESLEQSEYDHATTDPLRELQSKERIKLNILSDHNAGTHTDQPETIQTTKSWFTPTLFKYAACLILIGVSFYFWNPAKVNKSDYKLVLTTGNTRKNIKLADGSVIILNNGSSLSIAQDFNTEDRKIKLTGEGYFNIAKDKTRPFIIISGDLKTTVARLLPDKEDLVLSSGMVRNEVLVFNNKSKSAQIKTGDPTLYSSWTNNELYIDDASIHDIAQQLSLYYHIKTNVESDVSAADRYTIRLGNDSLNATIQILSQLTKYKFYYKQNQIYIMKNN